MSILLTTGGVLRKDFDQSLFLPGAIKAIADRPVELTPNCSGQRVCATTVSPVAAPSEMISLAQLLEQPAAPGLPVTIEACERIGPAKTALKWPGEELIRMASLDGKSKMAVKSEFPRKDRLDLRCTNVLVHLPPGPVNKPIAAGGGCFYEQEIPGYRRGHICAARPDGVGGRRRFLRKPSSEDLAVAAARPIFYMPTHIIEKQKLIEKHAALLGVPNMTTKWITFLWRRARRPTRWLAGGVDILNTPATGNLLLAVGTAPAAASKGIVACSAQPMMLISRRWANIKSLRDIGPQRQRSRCPTVKISTQAIVLQIGACGNVWRRPVVDKLDANHCAARSSRRLCGAGSEFPARGPQPLLRSPPFTFLGTEERAGCSCDFCHPTRRDGRARLSPGAVLHPPPNSPMPIRRSSRRLARRHQGGAGI